MNDKPAFFVPSTRSLDPESLYLRIKSHVQSQCSFPITDRRIFKLICEHNGTIKVPGQYPIEVGKPVHEKGKTVIVIFEVKDWYMVCTKNRGALAGIPMWIDGKDVVGLVEFNS